MREKEGEVGRGDVEREREREGGDTGRMNWHCDECIL